MAAARAAPTDRVAAGDEGRPGGPAPAESPPPFPPRDDEPPKGLNVLGTLARHPALATAFHTFNGHVLFATTLSPRQRELLVLRVAALRDRAYEWAQHVVLAGDAGLTPDEIARSPTVPTPTGWSPLDAGPACAPSTSSSTTRAVGDETWDALAAELDEQQLMDVVFTVGAYDLLAMALRPSASSSTTTCGRKSPLLR